MSCSQLLKVASNDSPDSTRLWAEVPLSPRSVKARSSAVSTQNLIPQEQRLIRSTGWDEGIIGTGGDTGMTLGEKSTLTISSDYAYGNRGFPGVIPPGATLVLYANHRQSNYHTLTVLVTLSSRLSTTSLLRCLFNET